MIDLNPRRRPSGPGTMMPPRARGGAAVPFKAIQFPNGFTPSPATFCSTVAYPDDASLDITGDITTEFWIKFDADPITELRVFLKTATSGSQRPYECKINGTGSGDSCIFRWTLPNTAQVVSSFTWGQDVLDTWAHVAFTRTQSTGLQTTYLNGVPRGIPAVKSAGQALPNVDGPVTIGSSDDGRYYIGAQLTEMRFWSVARTDEEILENYQMRLSGSEGGLELYLPFTGSDGYTDKSPNENSYVLGQGGTPTVGVDDPFILEIDNPLAA